MRTRSMQAQQDYPQHHFARRRASGVLDVGKLIAPLVLGFWLYLGIFDRHHLNNRRKHK